MGEVNGSVSRCSVNLEIMVFVGSFGGGVDSSGEVFLFRVRSSVKDGR